MGRSISNSTKFIQLNAFHNTHTNTEEKKREQKMFDIELKNVDNYDVPSDFIYFISMWI